MTNQPGRMARRRAAQRLAHRRLMEAARASERQAQADAYDRSECLTVKDAE